MTIPFVRKFEPQHGTAVAVSSRIRRVVAANPGPFTYTGTGTYIVGRGRVAVIDPGPPCPRHLAALEAALRGERVVAVLVTHAHFDHSPLAHPLAERFGARVHAGGRGTRTDSDVRLEAGDDASFVPDVVIGDDWRCGGEGWTLRAIETPGHTATHLCFWLEEERALLSGDHVMGWSTSVVSPPDGRMGDYLASLVKVRRMAPRAIYPAHGPAIEEDVDGFLRAYIAHREERERQVLDAIAEGCGSVIEIVRRVYAALDRHLLPAAAHSVLSHVIHLRERGLLGCEDEAPHMRSRLSRPEG